MLLCNIMGSGIVETIDPGRFIHQSDTWDATAVDYEALAEPFTRQYAERALAVAGGVRPGERVLDVAAGTGALTLAAARAGARVLATDFSPGMVARLSARLRAEGFDAAGCEAQVMDGQALELPDASFDAAFSVFGVMLFPDHRKGLAELARVLRPAGLPASRSGRARKARVRRSSSWRRSARSSPIGSCRRSRPAWCG
jgi:ubiquinone/menaquinone biosynthesis C-methylase UbiE